VPWAARTKIDVPHPRWTSPAHHYCGVYLFADSPDCPGDFTDWRDERIIYVVESEHLGNRWRAYARWIPETWDRQLDRIWVSAFPIWLGDDDHDPGPLTDQFRLYTERRIIWDLVQQAVKLLNAR
jgi:hypothetical protein